MARPTPYQGISVPQDADATTVDDDLGTIADGLEERTVMRFTDASDRDSTITTPVAGMVTFLSNADGQNNHAVTVYDGTAWRTIATHGAIVGMVVAYAGGENSIPFGWQACDGGDLDIAVYPDLFAAVGYAFGGAGSVFSKPDLRGRAPIAPLAWGFEGAPGAGTTRYSVGDVGTTGGTNEVTISEAQMPTHNHGGPSGIQFVVGDIAQSTLFLNAGILEDHGGTDVSYAAPTATAGSGNPVGITNPYQAVGWIIRTLP
ncbi:MAG: tail fiber protein [Actinomycetota bacterium]